ncbi:MAG: argininosuccinate lyase [Pseudomonadota bacterium]
MSRLWDKGAPLDARVLRYTAGEDHALDDRLVAYDVQGSIAHAEGLHAAGLLSQPDLDALRTALTEIGAGHARGEWRVTLEDEDGQTAIESRLTQRLGATGGRIHLGRSRNDQVLTALRLYLRDAVERLREGAQAVADSLHELAAREGQVALPGYTHMQQAMPSSVELWAKGFAAEIHDDAEGLRLAHRRIGKNPLGSAAGYGTPGLPLDRHETMRRLGFPMIHEPVTAVQLSRGKAEAQVLFEIALLMTDLGRLASDLMLFYTQEFAYVSLPDEFTTGSSIMPQKRNPDVFELIRGRTATAQGCLVEALGITAKLTSGYHRDLQLLKPPLFRGIDVALQTLDILPAALAGVKFRPENVRIDPSIHAAEQANRLAVEEGIPFREAYRRGGAQFRKD